MVQAKFSVSETQAEFLNKYKAYGFKDRSAMVRAALENFKTNMQIERLKKSADIYAELFSESDELQELTETGIAGWPE